MAAPTMIALIALCVAPAFGWDDGVSVILNEAISKANTSAVIYLGQFVSAAACLAAAKTETRANAFTWFDPKFNHASPSWASGCYARIDGRYPMVKKDLVSSGFTVQPPDTLELSCSRARGVGLPVPGTQQVLFAAGDSDHCKENVDVIDVVSNATTLQVGIEARNMLAAASSDGILMIGGGESSGAHEGSETVNVYDISTKSWSTARLSQGRKKLAAAGPRGAILFAGGFHNKWSDAVDIYDTKTKAWSHAKLSVARQYVGGGAYEDIAVFAGGQGAKDPQLTAVDIYNATGKKWTRTDMACGRMNAAVTSVNGYVLVGGGGVQHTLPGTLGHRSCAVDMFHVSSATWSKANFSHLRTLVSTATMGDGRMRAPRIDHGTRSRSKHTMSCCL